MPKANRRAPTVIRLNLNPAIARHRKVIEALDNIEGLQSIASVRARRVKQGQAAIEMLYRALTEDSSAPPSAASADPRSGVRDKPARPMPPPAHSDTAPDNVLGTLEDIMDDLQCIDPIKAMMG